MTKWQDMFKIEDLGYRESFVLVRKVDDIEVGKYNSYHYTKNRAKFFFKREMKKVEKILLGKA